MARKTPQIRITRCVSGSGGCYHYLLAEETGRESSTVIANKINAHSYECHGGNAFGADIDYAMLVKLYGAEPEGEKRYSPAKCLGANKQVIQGKPDMKSVSTSYVERQNLTMRMSMRRFTKLTNAFSKKLENHILALALYFMHYNFVRPHKSLANPYPTTPAMAAGLTNHIWTVEEIVKLIKINIMGVQHAKDYRRLHR